MNRKLKSDKEKKEQKHKISLGVYVYDTQLNEVFICTMYNIISIKLDFIGRYRVASHNEVREFLRQKRQNTK